MDLGLSVDLSNLLGLTEQEAVRRLKEEGPLTRQRTGFDTFEVVRQPMFLLLMAGATIYLVLRDMREAMLLFGFVFVVMSITVYQERKAEVH